MGRRNRKCRAVGASAACPPAVMSLGYTVRDTVILHDGPVEDVLFVFAYGININPDRTDRVRSYLRIIRLPARINVSQR